MEFQRLLDVDYLVHEPQAPRYATLPNADPTDVHMIFALAMPYLPNLPSTSSFNPSLH